MIFMAYTLWFISPLPHKSVEFHFNFLCFGRHHGGASPWVHPLSLWGGQDLAVLAREGLLPRMPQTVQEQAQVNPNVAMFYSYFIK